MYTLHRLHYSPYARKVQRLLELLRVPHRVVEVPYGNREELARLTGGYVYVPVLQMADGEVIVESRVICERLLADHPNTLVPRGMEGAVWAYHDHVEGTVEDVLFRLASPGVRDAWPTDWERALYTLVKERKFGAGCIEAWASSRSDLLGRARAVLAPTVRTLREQPFVFGEVVSLADLALYGQWAMLEASGASLLGEFDPAVANHFRRVGELR